MKTTISICLILALLFAVAPVNAQQDEERFLQGMMKEEGEGNLEEAIEIYSDLADDNDVDRSIRAKALLQMGICYEKQGLKKATMAYEKLIAEYGDQKDLIAVAKRKLKTLKEAVSIPRLEGVVIQELKKGLSNILFSVSPNGRQMVWMGYRDGAPELVGYDLMTAKEKFITSENVETYGSPEAYLPWGAVWSNNSKKLAYVIAYRFQDRKDLRISDANGSNTEVLMTGRKNNMTNYDRKGPSPEDYTTGRVGDMYDFSPDNKKLLFTRNRMVNDSWVQELAEMSISDKKVEVIKTKTVEPGINAGTGFKYSPDGKFIVYSDFSDDSNSEDIFLHDLENNTVSRVTSESFEESSPFWSPSGDEILFVSNNNINTDLFKMSIVSGKPVGNPELVMKDLGQEVELTAIDNQGAIYYGTSTTKKHIYTIDVDNNLELDKKSFKKISLPSLRYGGDYARFSKDGRYISYQTPYSEAFRGFGNMEPDNDFDPALGNKYAIFIYDSKAETQNFWISIYIRITGLEPTSGWCLNGPIMDPD